MPAYPSIAQQRQTRIHPHIRAARGRTDPRGQYFLQRHGAPENARHTAANTTAERHCEGDLCLSSHRSCPHRSPTPLKPLLRLECRFPCF